LQPARELQGADHRARETITHAFVKLFLSLGTARVVAEVFLEDASIGEKHAELHRKPRDAHHSRLATQVSAAWRIP
jgi:hypothetical protein